MSSLPPISNVPHLSAVIIPALVSVGLRGFSRMSERFNKSDRETLSRLLSRILRHTAKNEQLTVRADGFVSLAALLARPKLRALDASLSKIEQVIQHDPKSRLTLRQEGDGAYWIRANQGHSMPLEDLALAPIKDAAGYPTVLHGTNFEAWNLIREQGLKRMKRNHIHLAKGRFGVVKSGVRKNCQVFVYIDLAQALQDGIEFFESSNEVILTSGVDGTLSTKYFDHVESADGEMLLPPKEKKQQQPSTGTDDDASASAVAHQLDRTTLSPVKSMTRKLYGDMIAMSVPETFIDASTIRQVPDSQEVFLDPSNEDISLVIELVEALDSPDAQVGHEHYAALASDNEAVKYRVESCRMIQAAAKHNHDNNSTNNKEMGAIISVSGTQSVAKFNTAAAEEVSIVMGIIRLPKVTTDVLVTYNAPRSMAVKGEAVISAALKTFQVLDWRLFPECC